MTNRNYLNEVPANTSLLQPTKFLFQIPDLPFAKYFCQSVALPGISTTSIQIPNPFVDVKVHGDKPTFESLIITALVDEDLRVFIETYDWIRSYAKTESYEEYKRRGIKTKQPIYYDAVLTFLNNANLENLRVNFVHLHPISLSALNMDSRQGTEELTVNIAFAYDFYSFERIGT